MTLLKIFMRVFATKLRYIQLEQAAATHTYNTGFPFEQMFGFESSDIGHSSEYMRSVSGGSFQAVAMINLSIACFCINIKLKNK